jgi:hypothetical protein
VPDDGRHRLRNPPGDLKVLAAIAVGDERAAGKEHNVGAAQQAGHAGGGVRYQAPRCRLIGREKRGHVQLDAADAAVGLQRGQLAAGLADMRADHDQSVARHPAIRPDLRAGQGRAWLLPGQCPHERRTGAVQQAGTGGFRLQGTEGGDLQIRVVQRVNDDEAAGGRTGDDLRDSLRSVLAQVAEPDTADL